MTGISETNDWIKSLESSRALNSYAWKDRWQSWTGINSSGVARIRIENGIGRAIKSLGGKSGSFGAWS